jgi:hypothetical protein
MVVGRREGERPRGAPVPDGERRERACTAERESVVGN